MNNLLKNFSSSAVLTALALMSSHALAHPGWTDGGGVGYSWKDNTATEAGKVVAAPLRGYNIDAIRISHGCTDPVDEVLKFPIVANSWIWPQGLGGLAPMSTDCDIVGLNCKGDGSQPSVARIPDSTKKAHETAGQGVATTLASELVGGNATCAISPITHINECVTTPSTKPITTLAGRMQYAGNLGYFEVNKEKKVGGGGFWSKGNKFTAEQIAALGVTSVGAPFHNAIQVRWAETQSTSVITPLFFSPSSCARKLVVRLAGADICKLSPSRAEINDGHSVNYWFGGPTKKFTDGHGVHENFWLGYTLTVRNTTTNPYPESCNDKVLGDYDLVVMPTKAEIDAGLAFPGFATQP